MDTKSCKAVAEGHSIKNAFDTTTSAYIDMDSFVRVR
jgi:hypothetical protein